MPTTTRNDAALLDRAYGHIIQRGMERSWRRVFAGVREDENPRGSLLRVLSEEDAQYHLLAKDGVMSRPYHWEGGWGRVSLEVLDDGRLQIDCGPDLRVDDNVPFLKDLGRAERHDLIRAYSDMSDDKMIEYLEEDIVWDELYDYSTSRLDFMWWDLLGVVERSSGLERVSPEDIGALTDNHTMMTDELDKTDQGEVMACGRLYHFEPYMVADPIMELLTRGRIHLNVT